MNTQGGIGMAQVKKQTNDTTLEPKTIPQKTKQIGDLDEKVKIYIEDYVYTYLYQYAKTKLSTEKVALLVGRKYQLNGQDTLIISGAIEGKYSKHIDGIEVFTEQTWEYVGAELEKYFKSAVPLGWVHIVSGGGSLLNEQHIDFHKEHFKNVWQQAFLIDPIEKSDVFYSINEDGDVYQTSGYFLYYDKNEEMQEYMLSNSMVREKYGTSETLESKIAEDNTEEKMQSNATQDELELLEEKIRKEPREDAIKDIKRILNQRAEEVSQAQKSKHIFLVGASTTLCLFTLCLGFALNNSIARLQNLEGEFLNVQTSYAKLEEDIDSRVEAVFALQQTALPTEVIEEEIIQEEESLSVLAQTSVPEFHIVKEGDTLAHISRAYYGTEYKVAEIIELNHLTNANLIQIGQKLILPQSQ